MNTEYNEKKRLALLELAPEAVIMDYMSHSHKTCIYNKDGEDAFPPIKGNPFKLKNWSEEKVDLTKPVVDPRDQFKNCFISGLDCEEKWDQVQGFFKEWATGAGKTKYFNSNRCIIWNNNMTHSIKQYCNEFGYEEIPYTKFCEMAGLEPIKSERRMTHAEMFRAVRDGAVIKENNTNSIYSEWDDSQDIESWKICYDISGEMEDWAWEDTMVEV